MSSITYMSAEVYILHSSNTHAQMQGHVCVCVSELCVQNTNVYFHIGQSILDLLLFYIMYMYDSTIYSAVVC